MSRGPRRRADAALAAAIAPGTAAPEPETFTAISTKLFGGTAYGEPEAMFFAKDSRRVASPAADDSAVECAIFRSAYWPYHGDPAGFVAATSGRYRVRFRGRAVLQRPDGTLVPAEPPVPMTFRARLPSGPDVSGDVRGVGGTIDMAPEESDYETTVVLRAGHSTENCFLTAARGPTRSGFRNTISLDQFAADAIGDRTRFPTLNLGVNVDRANRSLAWTRDGVLVPAEDRPSRVYERLFVAGSAEQVAARRRSLGDRGSILDAVLDRTIVLFGSNMGDANTHDNTNLPILLAGGGFRHGRHLAFDAENNTPLSNLFLTVLGRLGVEAEAFGSSTGTLAGLE